MYQQLPRDDAAIVTTPQIQPTPRRKPWYARSFIVVLIAAIMGFGLFRGNLTFAETNPTDDTTPPAATGQLLAAQTTTAADLSIADVAALANPAVVTVYNLQQVATTDMFGRQMPGTSDADTDPQAVASGSGWIYDRDGHIVTNAHVVDGAESLQVQFYDGTSATADLVGVDTVQDVAVLKLNLKDDQKLPGVLDVGDSSALRAGDEVVAIGSPLGEYANTVTNGIVGGLDRSLDTETGSALGNLIQHDADISSGNSGGPLLNMQGQFVGMNVAKIDTAGQQNVSVSGLNFAIDGNTVVDRVEQIIAHGDVSYPYLGVETQTSADGTVVTSVVANSPADDAGFQVGDVITAIAGDKIEANTDLSSLLFQHKVGDTIDVTVERDGDAVTLKVTLGERPDSLT